MTDGQFPPARASHSRGLIILVVDTSESIARIGALDGLNRSLRQWGDDLRQDAQLRRSGRIAVVTFGYQGVRTIDGSGLTAGAPADPFVDVAQFNPRDLAAGGFSPMLEGIERGIEIIHDGVRALDRQNLLLAWRPVLCLISDGAPTDHDGRPTSRLDEVTQRIRAEEAARNLVFFAIGVPGADDQALRTLAGADGYYPLAQVDFMQALTLVSVSSGHVKAMAGSGSAGELKREAREEVEGRQRFREWLLGVKR